ncbi:uncharacterized protein A4U43_C05F6950 [Asparagus officinalis]|uniref:J domain-containing protein n=1 Tax=Asparagus officinalis TaxID=4686 RepID=A0A5P1EQ55_ASPOF|nr:uncharacterized protein A4U43_C05F6950 [Asparagus officinalis]
MISRSVRILTVNANESGEGECTAHPPGTSIHSPVRQPTVSAKHNKLTSRTDRRCASKSNDYAEIFGGISVACSIPFLDLPPPAEDFEGVGELIDYPEIFGGFSGGDFGVDYEELFKGKRTTGESSASSNGRIRTDVMFGQHAEVSDISPEVATNDHVGCSNENKFLSSSDHLDDGPKQYSMLYHRTSRGSVDDVINGKIHITELHVVPEYTHMINSCLSQDVKSNTSPNTQTKDLLSNVNHNGRSGDLEQNVVPPTSPTDNAKSHGADWGTHHKEYSSGHTAPEDDPVNLKHHSRFSSNYSASSGDMPHSDVPYVSVSDINLRTRPSKVPPPSRAPPKLVSKQENIRSHQIRYRVGASKNHGVQGVAKDGSSCFLDVEIDASSAAAASAAAMKEAMEQAQARLKSAKELMERKRDNLQSHKLGHKEGANYAERIEVKASVEGIDLKDMMVKKPLQTADKGMKEYTQADMQKFIKAAKTAPNHNEKERHVIADHHSREENGFNSSHVGYKSEGVSGEWKTEEQFYELINNEKKFRAIKEASRQEFDEKKPETTVKVNEDMENYTEKDGLANEINRTVMLQKTDETIQSNAIGNNSKGSNIDQKVESRNTPEIVLETCIVKEIKPEVFSSSHHRNVHKKLQLPQDFLTNREDLSKSNAGEESSSGESQMNAISPDNAFKFGEVYHDEEENIQVYDAEEGCVLVDTEKKLSGTCDTSASHVIVEKPEIFCRLGVQHEIVNEKGGASVNCVMEAEEEVAHRDEPSEYVRGNDKQESCYQQTECKLEDTISDSYCPESIKLDGAEGSCMPKENILMNKVAQKDNMVKLNSSVENSVDQETQLELQQNEKKQNVDQSSPVVEDSVEREALGDEHIKSENEKYEEDSGVLGAERAHIQVDPAQEVLQRAEYKNIGDVQEGSRVENENLGDAEVCQKPWSSSHDPVETLQTVVAENSNSDMQKREKMANEQTKQREREHEKEQARKLEEEKERERERLLSKGRHVKHMNEPGKTRVKAEKASAEALEKSLVEKALKEAKLRAERAAVERATAEARERAVEKALAERAAADARQRAERLNPTSRDKSMKHNETGDYFKVSDKADNGIRLKTNSSDVLRDVRLQTAGPSCSSKKCSDSSAHGEVESPLRCKARLERHQRTVERAAKALAEKNLRDVLAQREQAERNRLAESLDADVKRWSTGKEGNLRALLSTLQYILGPESGWQPVPLTDVITAVAVKKAYRKATLCVHPDKLQQRGASIQQKYICEKVFDLLKDAWNRFNSEER